MRTIDYFPCKVCKSKGTGEELFVPVPDIDPSTQEIKSIACKSQTELSNDQKVQLGLTAKDVLENCEITELEANKVVCYKCKDDYFYDGAAHKCRATIEYSTMRGCSLTFDNVHCMFCKDGLQLDITSGKCFAKNHKIDFSKLDSGMGPQYEDEHQAVQDRDEQMQSQMYGSDKYGETPENGY